MYFWDSSALVKLYTPEVDSPVFESYLASHGPVNASELVRWELFRVLARKEADGVIHSGTTEKVFAGFERDVAEGKVLLEPLDQKVEQQFRQLILQVHRHKAGVLIRTADAIHIATAQMHNAVEFVVTDTTMRKCALAVGVKVFPQ